MGLRGAGTMALMLAAAAPAAAQDVPRVRRGPLAARDEWLLAQPLLTLPAGSPDPLARGALEMRLDGDWGSDFGWSGGRGGDLRFLVDGEHRSGALTVRRGLGRGLTLGARLPALWRGAGIMDGMIDAWHRAFDLPDGGRSYFPDNELLVEARDARGRPLAWRGGKGTGLGNLELEAHQVLTGLQDDSGWRTAVVARVGAPTATGPFAHVGSAAGVQVLAAHPLGARADLYAGFGATMQSRREVDGLVYRRTRPQGFLAFEGRLTRGWSVIAQLEGAARLVTDIDSYPGSVAYLRVGSKFGLRHGWTLDGGITEGIKNEVAATDFGLVAGIARKF